MKMRDLEVWGVPSYIVEDPGSGFTTSQNLKRK